jgi:nucleoid-associated protein YgaU
MFKPSGELVRPRCAALWSATTAAVVAIASLTAPLLADSRWLRGPRTDFADLLVAGCAAATLVAAGWLWVITTDVVVRVLVAGGAVAVRRPGRLRLLLLATCGVVAVSTTAGAASADDRRPVTPPSLSGLPLPDRATGDAHAPDLADTLPGTRVRVRPGDSLWAIAEGRLGPRATVVDLVDHWHRIYDRNARVIGPDPDLILPGQLLDLPPID